MVVASLIGLLIYLAFAVVTHVMLGGFSVVALVAQVLGLFLLYFVARKLIDHYL